MLDFIKDTLKRLFEPRRRGGGGLSVAEIADMLGGLNDGMRG